MYSHLQYYLVPETVQLRGSSEPIFGLVWTCKKLFLSSFHTVHRVVQLFLCGKLPVSGIVDESFRFLRV